MPSACLSVLTCVSVPFLQRLVDVLGLARLVRILYLSCEFQSANFSSSWDRFDQSSTSIKTLLNGRVLEDRPGFAGEAQVEMTHNS